MPSPNDRGCSYSSKVLIDPFECALGYIYKLLSDSDLILIMNNNQISQNKIY